MASIHSETGFATQRGAEQCVEIDGRPIPKIVAPDTAAEVASILAGAGASGLAVAPIGGGTKLALGNIPERLDLGVSTLNLNQIHHYEAADMTLSVGAGARFSHVQAVLAQRGQTLPIETADESRATIGGLIATAFAGPRRLGSGTLRDLLIGISVAYPNGTVGKAGGLVVKNVTGFDLMRLHLGALGTLGVIVSANFKVLPLARTEATLISIALTLDEALTVAGEVRKERLKPIAIETFAVGGNWTTAARFEGRAETVAIGLRSARSSGSWAEALGAEESRTWWRRYIDRQSIDRPRTGVMLRCGATPKTGSELARAVVRLLAERDISFEMMAVSSGIGLVIVRFDADQIDASGLHHLQEAMLRVAGAVTLLSAPPALKAEIDVWGAPLETIGVMRALKAEFDPQRVLNPGRFVDRI